MQNGLTAYQSYLDIDAVDQEFILQKEIHVETAHHIDDPTPYDVRSSSHEPFVSRGSVDYLDGIHVSGRVLVPELSVAWPWHRYRNSTASLCRHDTHTCWTKGSRAYRSGRRRRRSRAVHHPPDTRNTRCNSSSEQSGPAPSKMECLILISVDLKWAYNRRT